MMCQQPWWVSEWASAEQRGQGPVQGVFGPALVGSCGWFLDLCSLMGSLLQAVGVPCGGTFLACLPLNVTCVPSSEHTCTI